MTDDEGQDDRPRNLAAERAVLGAMLLSPAIIPDVSDRLQAEDFYRPVHGALFAALIARADARKPLDLVSLAADTTISSIVAHDGGPLFLHDLWSETQTAAGVAHWCGIVADHAARARIADLGERLRQLGLRDNSSDLADLQDRAREAVAEATASRRTQRAGVWTHEFMDEHMAAYDEPLTSGVLTGLPDLDDLLGGGRGVLPGQMVVVAARPSVGKSVFMTSWALRAAHSGHRGVIFSLEMGRAAVNDRLIAAQGQVRIDAIEGRRLDATDRGKYDDAGKVVAELPIGIVAEFEATLAAVRSTARTLARSNNLGVLFLDYLQLLQGTGGRAADSDRRVTVDGFSRGMKLLAQELNVPVIALSQLNRQIASRQDKTPQLSDIRESGALEQDADVVLMLDREDARDRQSPRAGELDVHVVKNRNGPTGVVTVAHRMHLGRVESLAPSWAY